jgi:hypothetical protein
MSVPNPLIRRWKSDYNSRLVRLPGKKSCPNGQPATLGIGVPCGLKRCNWRVVSAPAGSNSFYPIPPLASFEEHP